MKSLKVRPDVKLSQVSEEGDKPTVLDSAMELMMDLYGMVGGAFNPPPWMNNYDLARFTLNAMICQMEEIARMNGIDLAEPKKR